jgi:hypothetical protein
MRLTGFQIAYPDEMETVVCSPFSYVNFNEFDLNTNLKHQMTVGYLYGEDLDHSRTEEVLDALIRTRLRLAC